MGVAAKAFHFEIAKPGVDRIAQRRRRRRTLKAEHALVPRLDGEPVGSLRASTARSADALTEVP
jgi:hypothetical protein